MDIAVTGATGFLGRYIVRHLTDAGHSCRCWSRPRSDRGGFEGLEDRITWIDGDLSNEQSMPSRAWVARITSTMSARRLAGSFKIELIFTRRIIVSMWLNQHRIPSTPEHV